MIDARELAGRYFHRIGLLNDASRRDPTYDAQLKWISDMVERLAVILEDEGIPDGKTERILRSVLYGAPTDEAANLRMDQFDARMKQAMEDSLKPQRFVLSDVRGGPACCALAAPGRCSWHPYGP